MSNKRKGELLMVACAVMWSIGGILMKYIDCNPFFIAGGRSLISSMVVLLYMYTSKMKVQFNRQSVPAGLSLCGCVTCFVCANKMTTAANAIVLQYVSPAVVLIISALFLGQKLRKMEVGVVALTFSGILLFFMDELDLGSMAGNFVAIISGTFMGAMFIFNAKIDDMAVKMSGILFAHMMTALIGLPVGIVSGHVNLDGRAVIFLVILGIVQLGIPYVLFAKASSLISPLSCSLLGMIEPLLNPVWVALFYGEIPGIFALTGGIIVLGAVIFYNIWDEKCSKS
ncbi:MAG: DMT family transporter [Firmicutes bacterium]|nr:DMT family transporter [Bacillota bacterium]